MGTPFGALYLGVPPLSIHCLSVSHAPEIEHRKGSLAKMQSKAIAVTQSHYSLVIPHGASAPIHCLTVPPRNGSYPGSLTALCGGQGAGETRCAKWRVPYRDGLSSDPGLDHSPFSTQERRKPLVQLQMKAKDQENKN